MVKELGQEAGGPWECYKSSRYYGWEAERVVVVTHGGGSIMEMITRAKTHLTAIIVEGYYAGTRGFFLRAAEQGLCIPVS